MKPIERLFEYFKYKGIKPATFERNSGLSNGYLSLTLKRKSDIGQKNLDKILDNCIDLNRDWLILGNGQMLKTHISRSLHEGDQPELTEISQMTELENSEKYMEEKLKLYTKLLESKEMIIQLQKERLILLEEKYGLK